MIQEPARPAACTVTEEESSLWLEPVPTFWERVGRWFRRDSRATPTAQESK